MFIIIKRGNSLDVGIGEALGANVVETFAPPHGLLSKGNRIKQKIPLPHTVPIHRA